MKEEQPQNLMEGLLSEMNRVRGIIKIYEDIEGGAGRLAATLMGMSVRGAEQSISSGDVIKMLQAYEDLKGYEL